MKGATFRPSTPDVETELSCERYWKDAGIHDVRLRTPLRARTLDAAILETMVVVAPLGG